MGALFKISAKAKWVVTTIIALIGAAGGAVAVFEYIDAKQAAAELHYERAMAEWRAFTPRPIGQNDRFEFLMGWYVDLDIGLIAMSLTGNRWDIQSEFELWIKEQNGRKRAIGTLWEGIQANQKVQWAHIGVHKFDEVGYREIRDAEFQNGQRIYRSHPTAAPGAGYIFAIKTSEGNLAKLQILGYEPHNSYSRKMILRYMVYPLVPDPPKPRRP